MTAVLAPSRRGTWIAAAAVTLATLYCLIVVWHVTALGAMPFDVPMIYQGDALQYSYVVDAFAEGSLGHIATTAAPFGTQHLDFPNGDIANMAIMAMLGPHEHFGVQFNLYFLLTVVLTTVSAFAVARSVGLSTPWACVVAVAFTLLPFHFHRAIHLFYTNYSACMWGLWLALRIGRPLIERDGEKLRVWPLVGLALATLWCGVTGVYFAFFTCMAIGFGGLLWAAREGSWRPIVRGVVLGAVIASATVVQMIPTMLFVADEGANAQVAKRTFPESDYYGLRVTQLLLPIRDHRIPALAALREDYDKRAPLVNENSTATLGLFGSIGLLCLFVLVLAPWLARRVPPIAQMASAIGVALLLVTTIGGFGSLFAVLVSPQMRALNRISPMIAACCLLVLALLLQTWLGRRKAWVQAVIAVALIGLITFDQIPALQPSTIMVRHDNQRRFEADQGFGAALMARLPPGDALLQLPSLVYPEGGAANGDYAQFRNNLHAPTLRWTHGAMKGRPEARWLEIVAAMPPEQLAEALPAAGYAGVVYDARLLPETLKPGIEALLAAGWARIDAPDATQFALLSPTRPATIRGIAPESGWHAMEGARERPLRWIWSTGDASLRVSPAPDSRRCSFVLEVQSLSDTTLTVLSEETVVSETHLRARQIASIALDIAADMQRLQLHSSAPTTIAAGGDNRVIGLQWRFSAPPVCTLR